jgi:hypothetical protein
MRRYEILLPLRFNDGTPVPKGFAGKVIVSIHQQFGAASFETQTIRGVWEHGGQVYRDDLVRLFADVRDTPANREWFMKLKERLKQEFQQVDIWIISHPIEVL